MILICFGTRPEYLKVKPLIMELGAKCKLLFTGQHPDLLKEVYIDYRINIDSNNNRFDGIVSSCVLQFPEDDFDGVVVQGDTASAFACALAAFHRKLKIIYVEAGLRSYDLQHPYPEEGYRQMISRISDINLAPTNLSAQNLKNEKVKGEIHVVGNTVLDNLRNTLNVEYTNQILITLHRNENLRLIPDWFTVLNKLAEDNLELEFILPMHPNPEIRKHSHILKNVNICEPLDHTRLIYLMKRTKFIISDSGGIQEEGSFLNKKIIVCRETTERPEGLDTGHLILCKSPKDLEELFYQVNDSYEINEPCPYGDGEASIKIKNIIFDE